MYGALVIQSVAINFTDWNIPALFEGKLLKYSKQETETCEIWRKIVTIFSRIVVLHSVFFK